MAEAFAAIEATPRYRLPAHVFACEHAGHMVFLDLKADRYFAVELPPGGIESIARRLIERGLLSDDTKPETNPGSPLAMADPQRRAPPIEAAADDCADAALDDPPRIEPRDVWRFAAATLCAWLAVRFLPLERMVNRVAGRRARHARGERIAVVARAAPTAADLIAVRRCAAVYERLQPLAFAARDACLFQSYAFLGFAARYGLYPAWVFGAQATPFAAHCWVQLGPLVLNDAAEHAAAYTPIMVA